MFEPSHILGRDCGDSENFRITSVAECYLAGHYNVVNSRSDINSIGRYVKSVGHSETVGFLGPLSCSLGRQKWNLGTERDAAELL